jgi:glycosyltransferase involved in cell wall biosynthesis
VRILQVHNHYRQPGGEDVVVAAEASVLRTAGHDVITHEVANPAGLGAAAALCTAPWNPYAARRVVTAARQSRPDVVHVHNTWFNLTPAVVAALSRAGLPVVLTLHNYRLMCANAVLYRDGGRCQDCVGHHPFHAVRHACYRGSRLQSVPAALTIAAQRAVGTYTNHVDVFVALSEFGRGLFIRAGLPGDRLLVKPHFVPTQPPRPAPPSSSREILCIGRLDRAKGHRALLEAFHGRRDRGLTLTIIGSGDDEPQLRRMAQEDVRFLGQRPRDEVMVHLRRARALAFPTQMYETFGLTVVEAMAAGTPVLASDLGGTGEVLGSEAGSLLPPADVAAWTSALDDLDDGWADAAGAAGRNRWAERFSPERGLELLECTYDAARARRRA